MAEEFQRPQGILFEFGGVNVRSRPDALAPGKYASAYNIRAVSKTSIQTRPGYTPIFSTGGIDVTDLRSYSTLGTDNFPRFIARDRDNRLWLDNGVNVANLAGAKGSGASLLPFRPSQSPQTWMYCCGLGDYQKISAPDASNTVVAQKVGIAEPQTQLEAAPLFPGIILFTTIAAGWVNGGTAGGLTDVTRTTETGGVIRADPVSTTRFSIQVGTAIQYQVGETVAIGAAINQIIQDVIPPVAGGTVLQIQAIRYASGSTGRCTIVPSQLPLSSGPVDLGSLRRGALVQINSAEIVLVLSVTSGPDGSVAFETSTTGTFTAGQALTGIPAIVVEDAAAAAGQTILAKKISSTVTSGIGLISQPLGTSPFALSLTGAGGPLPQQDDYIHLSVQVSDPTLLTELKLIFNVDAADTSFTENVYYYSIRPSDLVQVATGTQTQLEAILAGAIAGVISNASPPGETPPSQSEAGPAQWTEIIIPISALTRLGNDNSRTLVNCTGVEISVNVTGSVTFSFGSLYITGRGQPDTGDAGAPYKYRAVPRSSLTGAKGNATPPMRYGVQVRRQPVVINLPSAAYDSQIDTWDIYRYGGSVTSYRYLGSVVSSSATFTDTYFDDALRGGSELETDNFEPWPSVDVPFKVTSGGGITITVTGTWVVVTGGSIVWPTTILSWLPGTLIVLGGQQTYTLRSRPVSLSGTSYLFELEESANFGTPATFYVLEPLVARQIVPYLWGPNEYGDFFAVGDPLRPGTVYFSKSNNPDSAPDKYNLDLCPPSETLIGGDVTRGISLVSSTQRWWALYPGSKAGERYSKVSQPVGRGMVSPYGHCSDGVKVYFWARDCIASTDGGPYNDLTSEDFYNLFPHEGISGENVVRSGITYYAPDYSHCADFRLSRANYYLYADYVDTGGNRRTLVCDLRSGVWSQDGYANTIRCHYGVEQQEGSLTSAAQLYPLVAMADSTGVVYKQVDLHNDDTHPIVCSLVTREEDGGDQRADDLWGDAYLDCLPASLVTVLPVSQGAGVVPQVSIPASATRQFSPISLAGGVLSKFLGLALGWNDDFTTQSKATKMFLWQPSRVAQPEIITDRFDDWTASGPNRFWQGLILDADTSNIAKNIQIRDADSGSLHVLQPTLVKHNGRQTLPYSFATPFYAHSVRRESLDTVPWRKFSLEYISEPAPESVQSWISQATAHGMKGYQHVARIEAAYSSQSPVTLTIVSFDGTSPAPLTLPPTGGTYQKLLLTLTPNKGQTYQYGATSSGPFQLWLDDFIIWVGEWGRSGPYIAYRNLGGHFGDHASI